MTNSIGRGGKEQKGKRRQGGRKEGREKKEGGEEGRRKLRKNSEYSLKTGKKKKKLWMCDCNSI